LADCVLSPSGSRLHLEGDPATYAITGTLKGTDASGVEHTGYVQGQGNPADGSASGTISKNQDGSQVFADLSKQNYTNVTITYRAM
jgi:hypothetical protein